MKLAVKGKDMSFSYEDLRAIERKEDVVSKFVDVQDKPQPIGRYFPTTRTNIIAIEDDVESACMKIIARLRQLGYGVNFASYNAESLKKNTPKDVFYSELHKKVSEIVSTNLGLPAKERPEYSLWREEASNYTAFYLDVNVTPQSERLAARKIKKICSATSATENEGRPQRLLQALLELLMKVGMAQFLKGSALTPSDDGKMSKVLSVRNNLCFLVNTKVDSKDSSKIEYNLLSPSLFVTYQNEISVELSSQRYVSPEADVEATQTNEVDVFIPKDAFWGKSRSVKHSDSFSNDHIKMHRVSAVDGGLGIDFINTLDIGSSKLFYFSFYMNMLKEMLPDDINFTCVDFEPELRWRDFAHINPDLMAGKSGTKPRLNLIVALPKLGMNKPIAEKVTYTSNDTKLSRKQKTESKREYEVQYTNQEAVDRYLSELKEVLAHSYDVRLFDARDMPIDKLNKNERTLVIQEPKGRYFPGYAYIKPERIELAKEVCDSLGISSSELPFELNAVSRFMGERNKKALKEDPNAKWLSVTSRDLSTLNIRHERSKYSEETDKFVVDYYTALKIKSLDDRVLCEGGAASLYDGIYVTQGLHMPSYSKIAKSLLLDSKVPQSFKDEMSSIGYGKNAGKLAINDSALQKCLLDLEVKQLISDNKPLKLFDYKKEQLDLSVFKGRYCGYFVLKTQKKVSMASRYEFEVTDDGEIKPCSASIVTDIEQIRTDSSFPITELSVPTFHNDNFYLVDDKGCVLTCFTNKRAPQVLDSVADTGWAKGLDLTGLYFHVLDNKIEPSYNESEDGEAAVRVFQGTDAWRSNTIKLRKTNQVFEFDYDSHPYHASLTLGFFGLSGSSNNEYKSVNNEGLAGRYEWLYLHEKDEYELLCYLSQKQSLSQRTAKNIRAYRMIVKDSHGNTVKSKDSPLVALYIATANFNLNSQNSYSATSLLATMTKIVLKN